MNSLIKLSGKNKKNVIGLMSGTSADAIDAVLVELKDSGTKTKIRQTTFYSFPYDSNLKESILRNSNSETARVDDIARLNILLGELFANAANRIIHKAGLKNTDIDLIGSHGQTIHHLPERKKFFGKQISATLQIGDPAVIAKRTGIVTVGDFRVADVAVGGSGAPLVPYFDYLMFRSAKHNRGLLNIGGIANITIIPKRAELKDVFAFDTGPGNMLIDGLMRRLFNKPFDEYGKTAFGGKINPGLLRWLLSDNYFRKSPPKSTGREYFGEALIEKITKRYKNIRPEDFITTVTELTALSIYESYLKFVRKKIRLDEIIVSGGGVHNIYLMHALQRYFSSVKVKAAESAGYSSDAKEAICFAVLANETVSGNPANVIKGTGAKKQTILGKICLP
jgi:anhydro-N-acetylmuramic acid kinase